MFNEKDRCYLKNYMITGDNYYYYYYSHQASVENAIISVFVYQ